MKIGIDARLWNESGIGRYTRNLIKNLEVLDKKNKYILFALDRDVPEIKSAIKNKNFKVESVKIRWHSLEEQTRFPKILKEANLDLVHFPYFSIPIFYDQPFVVTIHDLILNHFFTGKASTLNPISYWIKRLGYRYVISQSAKKAKKILTVSNSTKQEIIDHLKVAEKNIIVAYEGADELINSEAKKPIMYGKYFLYVGNAYPHKNLKKLLEAFKGFSNENIKLILVGQEDYFYKKLKEENKNKNVIFLGNVSDRDLANLYKFSIAFVSPSLMEGFGLPLVEAMSLKCQIVASEIPVFREITNQNAVFFNPENIKDIEEKLKYVQKNYSKLATMRSKAYAESKKYSWHKMGILTLKTYEEAVQS